MKLKTCDYCGRETKLWRAKSKVQKGACKTCSQLNPIEVPDKEDKLPYKPKIKYKRKVTGEYNLFLEIYAERKGICQITGRQIPFDVSNFAHILSKGAYPSLRLDSSNILMTVPEIHHLYDNNSKEKLLEKYPEAKIIYLMKDNLRSKYYNS